MPFPLPPYEDATDGDGGLDAARGRLLGVCKFEREGRALGVEDPGLAGAELGACGSAGRRCGVAGGTWRLLFVFDEDGNAPESECGRGRFGGLRPLSFWGRGGGARGVPSGALPSIANCIVREVCGTGIGIGIAGGAGRFPG